jgi:hypothetical protein
MPAKRILMVANWFEAPMNAANVDGNLVTGPASPTGPE